MPHLVTSSHVTPLHSNQNRQEINNSDWLLLLGGGGGVCLWLLGGVVSYWRVVVSQRGVSIDGAFLRIIFTIPFQS